MGLLGIGLLGRARNIIDSMKSKFHLSFERQGSELRRVRSELQLAIARADDAEARMKTIQDENNELHHKIDEITKSWESFRAIANDANKIQKLIAAFMRIKRELLENRRKIDVSANTIEKLSRENARFRIILDDASNVAKVDIVSMLEQAANQKKDLSCLHVKCDQQDRLIKSLKDKEEKLLASLKRNA